LFVVSLTQIAATRHTADKVENPVKIIDFLTPVKFAAGIWHAHRPTNEP